jgi:hypothetical protein
MVRTPASKPVDAPPVDFGVRHAAGAGVSLVLATILGLMLLVMPMTPFTLHVAAAYGVLGLVGFLAQMVVAMEARLVPLATWFWAYGRSDFRIAPPSPHTMRDRSLQAIVFTGWCVAVPALAAGLFFESAALVSVGAWGLFAAVAIATLDNVFVLLHVPRQHPQRHQAEDHEVREEQRRHRRGSAEDALEQSGTRLA